MLGSTGSGIDACRPQPRVSVEPIRSLDAIQLATVLVLRDIQPDLRILSLDRRVRENAVALGFEILPAESLIGGSQA